MKAYKVVSEFLSQGERVKPALPGEEPRYWTPPSEKAAEKALAARCVREVEVPVPPPTPKPTKDEKPPGAPKPEGKAGKKARQQRKE